MGEVDPQGASFTGPRATSEFDAPSPLEARTAATRTELAVTLHGIQAVAGLSARNLEASGSVDELGAHFATLGALVGQFYEQGTLLDALVTSSGSA